MMRFFRGGRGAGLALLLGLCLLPFCVQASSLMQMSEQLDRVDHLELTDLLAQIRQCTTRRDFECADQRLAKARTLVIESKDRDNLARAYAALDQERHAVAMERIEAERRKREEEERRLAEERARARAREREEREARAADCARACSIPYQYRYCVNGEIEFFNCSRVEEADEEVAYRPNIAVPSVGIQGMREINQRLHANVMNAIRQQQQADQAKRERQMAEQRARVQAQEEQRRMRQAENDANRREQEAQRARARQAEQESLRAQEEQRRQRVAEQEARRAQEAQLRIAQASRSELQVGSVSTLAGSRPSTGGSPSQAADQARLARQQQEEAQRNEQRAALEQYLASMREGIRLAARTCYGELHVGGNRPSAKGSTCIDVAFRASCTSSTEFVDGVAKNFVGMGSSGCFGDTTRIQKMACPDNQINVRVTDVTQCR